VGVLECLGISSIRLGVPFIAPRQLGAVGGKLRRPSLPFVEWRTEQSGTPPDSYCSLSGARLPFQIGHIRPLQLRARWRTRHCPVHTGQFGAPCRPLELPRVTRRFRGRPLAQATVGSPDSPVNYSHVAFSVSRERRVRCG
jgi:hypothetical protein